MGRGAFDMTIYKMRETVLLTVHSARIFHIVLNTEFVFLWWKRPEPKCDFPQ
jgi:hypothetical protein